MYNSYFLNFTQNFFYICRSYVTNSLSYLLRLVIEMRKPEITILILRALPLLHFLQGDSKPYGILDVSTRHIKWGEPSLGITTLRNTMEGKSGYACVCCLCDV